MGLTDRNLEIMADSVKSMLCVGCSQRIDVAALVPFTLLTCPHCRAENTVPAQLGSFLLLATVGKGGMGAVYKARDLTLNRYVAIKVLRKEYGDDQQFLNSFLREARAAAALNHRNVAQIYSYGQEMGQPYIVMELLEGGRLDLMIEGDAPLEESFIMSTALHVAEGLQAAHEIGLIHGDIKPANILFDRKGMAKVVDFGLATFAKTHEGKAGAVWGTPYYIAPEKVRGKASDHRADIYSLGGTLFHALAKSAPFEGETALEVVRARLGAPAPSVRSCRADVTPETEAVIARMLERSTGRRYPTYASLLSDLRAADEAARRAAEARARDQAAAAAAAARSAARKPILLAGLAVVLLVGAGAGLWGWRQWTKPPERKVAQYILSGGKLAPVYEDELAPGARDPAAEALPAEPPSSAQQQLQSVAEALAGTDPETGLEQLAALVRTLDPADPTRAQAILLQGVADWIDGRPQDAGAALQGIGDDAPDPVRRIAGFLSGESPRQALEDASSQWTPGPRALTTLLSGLAALQAGEFDRATRELERYAAEPSAGWWTSLQPLVPRWDKATASWQTLLESLPADQPDVALGRVRKFINPGRVALRPVIRGKVVALEEAVEARQAAQQEAEQAARQRDADQVRAARAGVADLIRQGRFAGAVAMLEMTAESLSSPEAKQALESDLRQARRLAEVGKFLAEQLTAHPLQQVVAALGGRITGATAESVHIVRNGGTVDIPWNDVAPALYLKLLDYCIQKADIQTEARADVALSIACFWHVRGHDDVAARYGRLALRLDGRLAEEAATLLPTIELSATRTVP